MLSRDATLDPIWHYVSATLFLPHSGQLSIRGSFVALMKIKDKDLLKTWTHGTSVPSKAFEASFYVGEYFVFCFGFV